MDLQNFTFEIVDTIIFKAISSPYQYMKNTILTAICAIAQVIALIWYVISYIPGGQTGLKFFTKICTSTVTRASSRMLPV
ncbi:UNVERIFIED_CONTAM: hypothetical protein NCL1_33737 [Trichonephila clavipes]